MNDLLALTAAAKWYAVCANGVAIPCKNKEDAMETCAELFISQPQSGPYHARQLVDVTEILESEA